MISGHRQCRNSYKKTRNSEKGRRGNSESARVRYSLPEILPWRPRNGSGLLQMQAENALAMGAFGQMLLDPASRASVHPPGAVIVKQSKYGSAAKRGADRGRHRFARDGRTRRSNDDESAPEDREHAGDSRGDRRKGLATGNPVKSSNESVQRCRRTRLPGIVIR